MPKHTKNYNTAHKNAWRKRVWDYWRHLTHKWQIPATGQYWTLGDCLLSSENAVGELASIQSYGLLESMRSFRSVCLDEGKSLRSLPKCLNCGEAAGLHDTNYCPMYQSSGSWEVYTGKIQDVVGFFADWGLFRPTFINLDTTNGPPKAWDLAAEVGQHCSAGSGVVMAVNMISSYRSIQTTKEKALGMKDDFLYLQDAELIDPGIAYNGGPNCKLFTLFLRW